MMRSLFEKAKDFILSGMYSGCRSTSRRDYFIKKVSVSYEHYRHKEILGTRTLIGIILLAFVYIVSGYIGNSLAIPPGLVSPVWPPSGIAFAVILWFGYRYLPGVFLGSFIFNLMAAPQVSMVSLMSSILIGLERRLRL